MQKILKAASAAIALALPSAAMATIYDFNATETSALSPGPVSFSFSLDTSGAVVSGQSTLFNGITIVENGTSHGGNTVGAEFGTNLSSPLFFFVDTSRTPFSTGSGPGIVFNTGTFAIADGATDGEGSLTVSAPAAAAVPEPSPWPTLAAGAALLVGAVWRRRRWAAPM